MHIRDYRLLHIDFFSLRWLHEDHRVADTRVERILRASETPVLPLHQSAITRYVFAFYVLYQLSYKWGTSSLDGSRTHDTGLIRTLRGHCVRVAAHIFKIKRYFNEMLKLSLNATLLDVFTVSELGLEPRIFSLDKRCFNLLSYSEKSIFRCC